MKVQASINRKMETIVREAEKYPLTNPVLLGTTYTTCSYKQTDMQTILRLDIFLSFILSSAVRQTLMIHALLFAPFFGRICLPFPFCFHRKRRIINFV